MKNNRLSLIIGGIFCSSLLIFAACDSATMVENPEVNDEIVTETFASISPAHLEGAEETNERYLIAANKNFIHRNLGKVVNDVGGTIDFVHQGAGVAIISGLTEEAALELSKSNGINQMEPEVFVQLESELMSEPDQVISEGESVLNDNPENAFFFARQWNMNAISAPDAWDAGKTGSEDVTVAILDTGIDYTYPDLAGLVDLDRSVSFIPGDDVLVEASFPGAHPIADLHYHGTHVAATVSSQALAAAGVTSKTTLMGVKVCSVAGSCPTGAVLAGILHAADNGADIINMSLGGLFLKSANPGFVSLINNVANYAHRQGSLVVVSAGNSAADLNRNLIPVEEGIAHAPSLFASYCDAPGVFCVSATGPEAAASIEGPWQNVDASAPYTNFGSAINVAAPGGFASAVSAGCSTFSLQVPICRTGFYVIGVSGTSMASPHAAGVAALIKADNPNLNPAQLSRAIERASDKIDGNGQSPFYGQGRVNAATAVGL